MPITFTCPQCHNTTQVYGSYAGQSGPCAQCGATITIPHTGHAARNSPANSGKRTSLIVVAACLLLGMICIGGPVAWLISAVSSSREASRRISCAGQLSQIGLALHNYHDTHKAFPPAYFADKNGTPTHSWRMLIMPYAEGLAIYDQYDFDEPWNGPHNSMLHSHQPEFFQCPSDGTSSCNYFLVNVPGSLFDGPKNKKFADVTDGTSQTIMVVEAVGTGIHWMEPRDLGPAALAQPINGSSNGSAISSMHVRGANVMFADGRGRFLDEATTRKVLNELVLTSDGNQNVVP